MARRAPISDRIAAAIDNARDPRDRELLIEVADVISRLTRAHYDLVAALAISDQRSCDGAQPLWDSSEERAS